jgi:hypothetical protein
VLQGSTLSKEEQLKKNRNRAEIYAVNAYLKDIERQNFEKFKSSRGNASKLETCSIYSDDSTVCPEYEQKHLLTRHTVSSRGRDLKATEAIKSMPAVVHKKRESSFGAV